MQSQLHSQVGSLQRWHHSDSLLQPAAQPQMSKIQVCIKPDVFQTLVCGAFSQTNAGDNHEAGNDRIQDAESPGHNAAKELLDHILHMALTLLPSSLRLMRCLRLVMCASFGGRDLATRPATTALLLYRKPSSSAHTGRDSLSPDSLHVVQRASLASSGFTCTGQMCLLTRELGQGTPQDCTL